MKSKKMHTQPKATNKTRTSVDVYHLAGCWLSVGSRRMSSKVMVVAVVVVVVVVVVNLRPRGKNNSTDDWQMWPAPCWNYGRMYSVHDSSKSWMWMWMWWMSHVPANQATRCSCMYVPMPPFALVRAWEECEWWSCSYLSQEFQGLFSKSSQAACQWRKGMELRLAVKLEQSIDLK